MPETYPFVWHDLGVIAVWLVAVFLLTRRGRR